MKNKYTDNEDEQPNGTTLGDILGTFRLYLAVLYCVNTKTQHWFELDLSHLIANALQNI